MDIKLDENLPREIVFPLKQRGHDVTTILDERMGGADDKAVVATCQKERRVLITLDTDFSDARKYAADDSAGIICLLLKKQSRNHVLAIVKRLLDLLDRDGFDGCLWIVDETRERIRGRERR